MTAPERYAEWSTRADPNCRVCRGMGYAYHPQQDPLSVGERIVRGLPPPKLGSFTSGCECLALPQSELARERKRHWSPRPPEEDGPGMSPDQTETPT